MAHGTKKRMMAVHEKPNYGGSAKPTTPDIKKSRPPTVQNKYSLQRDQGRSEAKFTARGAAKPWVPKGRAKVKSKI